MRRKVVVVGLLVLCCAVGVLVFFGGARLTAGQEPGSAQDPVLTRAALQKILTEAFAEPRARLEALEARMERLAAGVQELRDLLAATFRDLRGHWAHEYVAFLRLKGIVAGYPDGTFRPEEKVTRAALAVMTARARSLPPAAGPPSFPDVPPSHWAAGAVAAASAAGYLKGYPDGTFRPNAPVTRAEAAAVLARAFALPDAGEEAPFPDLRGHWASAEVAKLVRAGACGGYPDGTFRPNAPVTRAEAAKLLASLLMRG